MANKYTAIFTGRQSDNAVWAVVNSLEAYQQHYSKQEDIYTQFQALLKWTSSSFSAGQILIASSTNGFITALSAGTSGQFLQSNGAGVAPSWVDLSAGDYCYEEITWANLKTKRDASQLTKGKQYRITDYTCTTTTSNTSSAGHVFDIIVLALETNKLSEEAWATHHSGDTYFANNNLSAWKLLYSLDNDHSKFSWAAPNGIVVNGLIYYRDTRYDDSSATYPYAWVNVGSYGMSQKYTATRNPTSGSTAYATPSGNSPYSISSIVQENGKGVIYYMKDEFNNECPYDFKNILFTKSGSYTNAYTFTYTENNELKDASIVGLSKRCFNNIMKEYYYSNKLQLNFNVFYSIFTTFDCYFNTFDNTCNNNTFGNYCYSNTFNNACSNNTFGNYCYSNTFGNNCYSNTFGNVCIFNTFGNYCYYNTFENNCYSNTFGDECRSNTFGNECHHNAFGNHCYSNTFSTECPYNTFGNHCYSNTFGNNCYSNTFGNECYRNIFGIYCSYNTFGDDCFYNTFGTSSSAINYCRHIIFDNGCSYIYLFSDDTTASRTNRLQNVHIHLGVKGTPDNIKTITESRNLDHTVDYYPIGSETKEI